MFKIPVLQSLYNLSDEQTEFLIRDRFSFMRFLALKLKDTVPDATAIWLLRECLTRAGQIDKLFDQFGQHLETKGNIERCGQILDASIVTAPKQRNTKEDIGTLHSFICSENTRLSRSRDAWLSQKASFVQRDTMSSSARRTAEKVYGADRTVADCAARQRGGTT
jgi:IS5 family transposase